MTDLWLQLRMLYYEWRCRKCKRGDHAWHEFSSQRSADIFMATGEEYEEYCDRPSCTALR